MTMSRNALKDLRQLGRKKYRAGRAEFLIEGVRLVQEAADSDREIVRVLYSPDLLRHQNARALLQKLHRRSPEVSEVSEREISDLADTVHAQGIVAVVKSREVTPGDVLQAGTAPSVLVGVDAVADPGNLGSMIRTCDWFGVQGMLIGRNSVELSNPKVLRATMGSVFHLPVAERVDLPQAASTARSLGYTVYVTDAEGETHYDRVTFANRSIILFGNEAWGVSDQLKQLADVRLAIRRYGSAESLNVGVACGIVLSGLHRLYAE